MPEQNITPAHRAAAIFQELKFVANRSTAVFLDKHKLEELIQLRAEYDVAAMALISCLHRFGQAPPEGLSQKEWDKGIEEDYNKVVKAFEKIVGVSLSTGLPKKQRKAAIRAVQKKTQGLDRGHHRR